MSCRNEEGGCEGIGIKGWDFFGEGACGKRVQERVCVWWCVWGKRDLEELLLVDKGRALVRVELLCSCPPDRHDQQGCRDEPPS